MKITRRLSTLVNERRPVCIAAGFFDGLHRGHKMVLLSTVATARACGGTAWALTFENHPLSVLRPDLAPPLLTSVAQKTGLLAAMGMDGCLMLRFTRAFADQDPAGFVDALCRNVPALQALVIGANWRFGRNGTGDYRTLTTLMKPYAVAVSAVRPVRWHGLPVSSTRIRNSVAMGRLNDAFSMLGRPFSIAGTVRRGRRIGRTLGFPTANLAPHSQVRPPDGVYAVQADIGGHIMVDGVLNIGNRPTFGRAQAAAPSIELHLPGFSGSLYGRDVEVFFIRRMRPERRFASAAALAAQIARDVRMASRCIRKDAHKII